MPMPKTIHLVGSIRFENAEEVFRTLANTVGNLAPRYPDGETGERHYFVRWQGAIFDHHPAFEKTGAPYREGAQVRYEISADSSPDEIGFPELGYAKAAVESYELFARLKADGEIPSGTRFQVALPTPTVVLTAFVMPDSAVKAESAYEQAMLRELAYIFEHIPASELAIQWDVVHEVLAFDGAMSLHYDDIFEGTIQRIQHLCRAIPDACDLGFHLCYGDPGHKHILEPTNLATGVKFANAICRVATRTVDWVHMPVPRDRSDVDYFSPLQDLDMPDETELILGLVHHTDGENGTKQRMAAADTVRRSYGIATECGFGRREPSTMIELLNIHKSVA